MSAGKTNATTAISALVNNEFDVQSNAAKKKSKKKNKSKLTSKVEEDHSSAGSNDTKQRIDDIEIQQMSQELLKRLQINGDTNKKSTTLTVDGGQNGKLSLNQNQQAVNASNSANKLTSEHVNYNNNNCKSSGSQDVPRNLAEDVLCNGGIHESSHSETSEASGSEITNQNQTNVSTNDRPIAMLGNVTSETEAETEPSVPPEPNKNESITGETTATAITATLAVNIIYKEYENELQMPDIMRVIQRELSEPYSIYTYRYFIHNWPKLCFLAMDGDHCVGAIVCKLDIHRQVVKRGYIAMLAVEQAYRKLKVGTTLVQKAIEAMLVYNADEVVLETEITNIPALRLYENLGFVRDKRLFDYYLNGVDALRLKLWFK